MTVFRPVIVLILAVWFLQLAGGMLAVVVPLGLSALEVGPVGIGAVAALYALGLMAGALTAPRLVARIGNIRTYAAAAGLVLIGSLLLGLSQSVWLWTAVRLIQGAGFATLFAAAESWLGQAAPPDRRGSVLGAYNVAAKAALMTGPFLIAGAGPLAPDTFLVIGLCLSATLLPICLTHQLEPERSTSSEASFVPLMRTASAAAIGCFMAGVINSGTLALLPIFAADVLGEPASSRGGGGTGLGVAALAYAAANLGGLLAQWPIGRASDRFERRRTIAVQAALAGLAALIITLFGARLSDPVLYALIAIWGAGSLTFYSVCVAHGIDRVAPDQVTALMGALITCWATGSVLGPVLAGFAMRIGGTPSSLFMFTALGLFVLCALMLFRVKIRAPAIRRRRWTPAFAESLAGRRLIPRPKARPPRH